MRFVILVLQLSALKSKITADEHKLLRVPLTRTMQWQ